MRKAGGLVGLVGAVVMGALQQGCGGQRSYEMGEYGVLVCVRVYGGDGL